MKCRTCKAPLWFNIYTHVNHKDANYCRKCAPDFTYRVPLNICPVSGCTRPQIHRSGPLTAWKLNFCKQHGDTKHSQRYCTICNNAAAIETTNCCIACMHERAQEEHAAFRELDHTPAELHSALAALRNYVSLGTYEELADAVCRRDIERHADELSLK